jgi:hypothetical protein
MSRGVRLVSGLISLAVATGLLAVAGSPSASTATAAQPMDSGESFKRIPAPKIVGAPYVGDTLSVDIGDVKDLRTWNPRPSTVTYQWYRAGKAIKGAVKASYKLTSADRGKAIKVKMTAKKAWYRTTSKSASTTKVVSLKRSSISLAAGKHYDVLLKGSAKQVTLKTAKAAKKACLRYVVQVGSYQKVMGCWKAGVVEKVEFLLVSQADRLLLVHWADHRKPPSVYGWNGKKLAVVPGLVCGSPKCLISKLSGSDGLLTVKWDDGSSATYQYSNYKLTEVAFESESIIKMSQGQAYHVMMKSIPKRVWWVTTTHTMVEDDDDWLKYHVHVGATRTTVGKYDGNTLGDYEFYELWRVTANETLVFMVGNYSPRVMRWDGKKLVDVPGLEVVPATYAEGVVAGNGKVTVKIEDCDETCVISQVTFKYAGGKLTKMG